MPRSASGALSSPGWKTWPNDGPAGGCRPECPASARTPTSGRSPGLAGFLAARDVTALAQVDRALLERYLADLHREFAGRDIHGKQIGQLAAFLADTRQHGWDATLQADAALCPEDYPAAPQAGSALPRHVAEHVMQHVEDEARLARWTAPPTG